MENNKIVTFELNNEKDCIEIHGNSEGLKYLADIITKLSNKNNDNEHLMTESWGGNELSEKKIGINNDLINHVKIFCWEN